ncbi:hypothetical protein BJY52DRAFT_1276166 [Lactarius psammicola]|nr:hypothetical protein BJY52DRAFT_1276166 [Lactarius psammicola]
MFWTTGIYPGPSPDPDQESETKVFIALHCLANFFTNFVPNLSLLSSLVRFFPCDTAQLHMVLRRRVVSPGPSSPRSTSSRCANPTRHYGRFSEYLRVSLTGIVSLLLDETIDQSLEEPSRGQQRGFIHAHVRCETALSTALPFK